jgi:hypothetical protein
VVIGKVLCADRVAVIHSGRELRGGVDDRAMPRIVFRINQRQGADDV